MTGEEYLVQELKKYQCLCFYPSSGTDLGDLDYFGSGRRLLGERIDPRPAAAGHPAGAPAQEPDPDLFVHTEINFHQEFDGGLAASPVDCGLHGPLEVEGFRELPALDRPNAIYDNFPFSGRCFEYRVRLWQTGKIRTLIYCLCENEFFVSRLLLRHGLAAPVIWSRNWAGGRTYGTWMANVLDRLRTVKVYTDWLCIPGQRGEPPNRLVTEKYPDLMVPRTVQLVRNNDRHWIDEGAHGWVEEFDVVKTG